MTPERYQQIGQLYHAALELEPEERTSFLDRACGGDEELRREVESLLQAHAEAGAFFAVPALEVAAGLLNAGTVAPGQSLGHFKVLSLIGAGGMGEVYLAQDTRLGRKVALKLLPAAFTEERERVRRLEREARAASSLNHPNILTIYEIGEVANTHYIATEFIEGETLRAIINKSGLKLDQAIDVAVQVASALSAAHEAGITHRDIKPENIMVRPDGLVKILDFGLAMPTGRDTITSGSGIEVDWQALKALHLSTQSGMVKGTVRYMSPEQAAGLNVDPRSDLFSLGVVLYEMLAGRPPFEGETSSGIINSIEHEEPVPLTHHAPGVPDELERIVSRALRKDLEARYQSAKDLYRDLKRLQRRLERDLGSSIGSGQDSQPAPRAPVSPHSDLAIDHHRRSRILRSLMLALAFSAAAAAVGFVAYKLVIQSREESAASQIQINRLTISGNVVAAAISSDGKLIAYAVSANERQSLWVRRVDLLNRVQLLPEDELEYHSLAFSPDGSRVFYIARRWNEAHSALHQIPASGGTLPQQVFSRADGFSLSPDGEQVAIILDSGESRLIVSRVDGTESRTLARREHPAFFAHAKATGPAWSPDGKIIACGAGGSPAEGHQMSLIGVLVADGTEVELTSKRWSSIGNVAWGADGSLVLTAAEKMFSHRQVWLVTRPGGEARAVSSDLHDYNNISLTADARRLAAVQTGKITAVWVGRSLDLARARRISSEVGTQMGLEGMSWTADGRLAYTSNASGNPDIWVMNADGTGQKQLTFDAAADFHPAASPDGRYIVFASNRAGAPNIWRMDLNGENLVRLTAGGGESRPQCSPDGRWVIYQQGPQLWRVPLGGGLSENVVSRHAIRPAISPDGRWIAHFSMKEALWGLEVTPFAGGEAVRRFELPASVNSRMFRWTSDGKALAYVAGQGGVSNIWTHPLSGVPPRPLTDLKTDQITYFEWSRDGSRMAYTSSTETSDVVLISNFQAR